MTGQPYTFAEQRGGRHLLVWGEHGQWLVVDAEARLLIDRLSQCATEEEALRDFALRAGRTQQALPSLQAEAAPLLAALRERGLDRPARTDPADETISIANLTVNLTNRCNLRCRWCYNHAESAPDSLILPEFLHWLNDGQAAFSPQADCFLLGGEPCLEPERLTELLRGARALQRFANGTAQTQPLFRELLLSTNGTLLTPELIAVFRETDTTVQVSLDSAHEAAHDAIRGAGVFRQATEAARRLVNSGVRVIFSQVLTSGAEEELEQYFDLAARLGAQEVRFIPLRRLGNGAKHSATAPDLCAAYQKLQRLLARRPELLQLLGRDFFSILQAVCRQTKPRGDCGLGRRVLFVDADGGIYPCPNHRSDAFRCGRVGQTALTDLLHDTPCLRHLREQTRLPELASCRSCHFRHWCAGDCRAEARATGGDLSAPSPYCAQLQRLIPELFWTIAAGKPSPALSNSSRNGWV